MPAPARKSLYFAASLLALCLVTNAEGKERSSTSQAGWDNTVNSLLAAGMYGFSSDTAPDLTVQLQHADTNLLSLSPEAARVDTRAITFSYEGSSGLLEFSAGYMLANQRSSNEQGAIFLGINPETDTAFEPNRSWYLALDLSRSYQVDENISFNFGNRVMLLKNPFDTKEGHIFSMLFNMPISYKNYLTITPALQWSQPLSGTSEPGLHRAGPWAENSSHDVFYGGVSISFSY